VSTTCIGCGKENCEILETPYTARTK